MEYAHLDQRNFKSEKEYDEHKFSRFWKEDGCDHGVNETGIFRYFKYKGWFVEIENLKQLLEFSEKYGRLVVDSESDYKDYGHIEIYDDYRE